MWTQVMINKIKMYKSDLVKIPTCALWDTVEENDTTSYGLEQIFANQISDQVFIFLLICFLNVYSFLREREKAWAKEEQGGHRIQSRLRSDSTEPNARLKPMNCETMTWAEVGCSTHWATQTPPISDHVFLSRIRDDLTQVNNKKAYNPSQVGTKFQETLHRRNRGRKMNT